MNSIQFSSVTQNFLEIGEKGYFAQFIRLQKIKRGVLGMIAFDHLFPIKPKQPV